MPILKTITAPTGAVVGFHKAMRAHFDFSTQRAGIDVASWVSESEYLSGLGLVWNWPIDARADALQDIDAALVQIAPFDGGIITPDGADSLGAVQSRKLAVLEDAYSQAILVPVTMTTDGGVTQTYQANPASLANASNTMLGCMAAQATPPGFYWLAADNTRVPFTYHDLQKLAAAFFAQGVASFAKLQDLKVAVRAATTPDAVVAINWPD